MGSILETFYLTALAQRSMTPKDYSPPHCIMEVQGTRGAKRQLGGLLCTENSSGLGLGLT